MVTMTSLPKTINHFGNQRNHKIVKKHNKGLVIINTRDWGGRKYNFFSKKLVTHPTFASNFHTPSENLPNLSYPNMYKLFMC